MQIKSCPVQVKAVGDGTGADQGQFEAIVSVFGNVDSYGDVVIKGAFTESLAAWAAKGDPIPVYWSHQMSDPDSCIGEVIEAYETDEGLYVKAQIDLDTQRGSQVFRLLKGRRVTQFSFAYETLESGWAHSEELGDYLELRKLGIFEVGPTPIGANQETSLLGVKHAVERLAADPRITPDMPSAKRDELTALAAELDRILNTTVEGKASEPAPTKDEEPPAAKSTGSAPTASVDPLAVLAALQLEIQLSA